MSSEQVAGILRQCPQQVRLVVARGVREPTSTDTPPPSATLPNASATSEILGKATNNNANLPSTRPSLAMLNDNDGIIGGSQNKILLRTERLLESNHNFEKILENLREQVHRKKNFTIFPFFLIDMLQQEEKGKRKRLIISEKEYKYACVTSFSLSSNTYIFFSLSLLFGIFSLLIFFLYPSFGSLGHFLLITLHHSRRLLDSRVFTQNTAMTGCTSSLPSGKRVCVCVRERESESER
jgi:hypothetical protein